MYYSFDFSSPIPPYLSIYMAISVFLYEVLDNCDGKQARRTGNSTPLGMLIDHNVDSLVTWIIGISIVNVF